MYDSQQYWVVPASRLFPSATEGSPLSVAHGDDIDNFLSIGVPQVPSGRGRTLKAGGAGVEWVDGVGVWDVLLVERADCGVDDGNYRDGE
jgi:hypothetical protein